MLTITLLALALAGCGKSPEQHFQEGKAHLEKAEYRAAILELKSALQEQPKNQEARLLLGKSYLSTASYAEAEKEFTKARQFGASDESALPGLIVALQKQGKLQKVLDIPVPASGLNPKSLALIHVARAEAFMGLNKRDEALQSIQAANQVSPDLPELLLFKAKLALVDTNKAEAMQLIDASLQKDAKYTDALYMKAGLLQQEQKTKEAEQVYREIVAIDDKQVRAILAMHLLQLRAGNLQEAEKSLQTAEKIAGKVPLVKYYRGIFELQRGKLKEANEAFQYVLKTAPNHLPSILAQGIVSFGMGNYEQSLKNSQRVLALDAKNAMAARLLAASQLKTGDINAAKTTLESVLKTGAEDPKMLNLAAEIYFQNKEYSKAMSYLDRAVALSPKNAALKAKQAVAHLQMGDDTKAMADLEDATKLSDKPGRADLGLITLSIQRSQFDEALKAINALEKKLPNHPVTHNLRAIALLGKQDRVGARKELERALAIEPTFIPAAMSLARLDVMDKDLPTARKRFETILAKDQNNLQAMLALADLAAMDKQEKRSLEWLEKASKAHPESLVPVERLIQYHLAKKDSGKAMELARQAVKANPNNDNALALLGSVQAATGNMPDSIASFSTLVEKNKQSPQAYLQLALAQLRNKQNGAGRENLGLALQLKPDFVKAQETLMQLELLEKKPDAARKIARTMQEQNPRSPLGYEREGDILASQKNFAAAVSAYELALGKGGKSDPLIKLHRAILLSGDTKGADKRLNTWLSSHPKDIAVRRYAAETYTATGRPADAIAQYEAILKSAPGDVPAMNNLADLYHRNNDSRDIAIAEQALKLAPDQAAVMDTLGWILVERGQLPRGLAILRKASAKMPDVPTIRYHLAVALYNSGDKAAAKNELEAALKPGQGFPEEKEAKALRGKL